MLRHDWPWLVSSLAHSGYVKGGISAILASISRTRPVLKSLVTGAIMTARTTSEGSISGGGR